ncbi:MAG: hypothetical protein CR997_06260 [Acidobacteria bacterium]|nr:MAG: hypothetical protein CR997_06260 [Acidobacteriota bacterium]
MSNDLPNEQKETLIINNSSQLPESSGFQTGPAKYEVVRLLGRGGFASVYLVKNLDLDRLEAIKILSGDLMDSEVLERFVKEAKISANFNHQNIITIYEVRQEGDWDAFIVPDKIKERHREPFTYFTMSYVEGRTAAQLIKKEGCLSTKRVLKIAIGATKALDYAHSKAVIHRDIKPENIIVNRAGEAIVMDFGIAKAANRTRKTAAGTFMGTARYVSPEQAMGKDVDGRSDLYSLGITLYELAVGKAPFDSEEWMTVLYQHINEKPTAPSEIVDGFDRDFQNIILKLLEKSPKNRFQNAKELIPLFEGIYNRLGGDEYGTEALEKIATRADTYLDSQPSELRSPPKRVKPQKERPILKKNKRRTKLWILPVLAILISLAAWYAVSRHKPVMPTEPVIPNGQIYLTVFPSGYLAELQNEHDRVVELQSGKLPQLLELQEGRYRVRIKHGNQQKILDTFIEANQKTRLHTHFEVDPEDYLLEDLK